MYRYDRRASKGVVIRPEGWRASNDEPDKWTRSGHLYRGMTESEYHYVLSHGHIKSNESYSLKGEGTNFADGASEAESYVNYGRDDPRVTGKPTYIIEVKRTDLFKRWPDGYWKAPEVPRSLITRVWTCVGEGDAVVAYEE